MPLLGVGTGFEGQVQVVLSKVTVAICKIIASIFSAGFSAVDPTFDYIIGTSSTRARVVFSFTAANFSVFVEH